MSLICDCCACWSHGLAVNHTRSRMYEMRIVKWQRSSLRRTRPPQPNAATPIGAYGCWASHHFLKQARVNRLVFA
eukprot:5734197-Amphidinium_carterae.1